jgi:hypothetical protein
MTNTTEQLQAQQEADCLHNRIASFFDSYQIGSLLNRHGIRKLRGATALQLFTGIFMLAFEGVNFFRLFDVSCGNQQILNGSANQVDHVDERE